MGNDGVKSDWNLATNRRSPNEQTKLVKSHYGAWGNILAGPPKHFWGPLNCGKNVSIFFQNGSFWYTLYFWV